MGTGVEPSKAATEGLHLELSIGQELLVDGSNLVLATCRGLDMVGYIDNLVGVEVEAHNGVVALGVLGLLLDAEAVALAIELGHTVALGVADPIAEDGGLVLLVGSAHGLLEHARKTCTMEDVVAQHKTGAVVADEVGTNGEGLGQAIGRGLLGILEMYAIVGAIAKQTLEAWEVVGSGDDEYITDTSEHEHTDGVIDHGLVVDGHQLLADAFSDGVQTGTTAAG